MGYRITGFLRRETGAVTVDWTVLSAAAVSMALATVAVLEDGLANLVSRVDHELRSQQLSDGFVSYQSGDFEALIANGTLTAEDGEAIFYSVNALMNSEILAALELGIEMMEAGTLPLSDLPTLVALASVARQRDIAPPEMLEHFFGFGQDGPPLYLSYF